MSPVLGLIAKNYFRLCVCKKTFNELQKGKKFFLPLQTRARTFMVVKKIQVRPEVIPSRFGLRLRQNCCRTW